MNPMRQAFNLLGTLAMLSLIAACASGRPAGEATGASAAGATTAAPATAQERALARYQTYASRPVKSFTWLGRFDSWEPLGKDHLLVFTRPNEAYLLKVSGPCDVRFATGPIGITSTNSTVYAGLDSIAVNSGIGGKWQCPIDEIRPLDVRGMKADLQSPEKTPPQR
jgi:hypothetical protein